MNDIKSPAAPNYKDADSDLIKALRKVIATDPNRYTQRYLGAQIGSLTEHGTYSGSYVSNYLSRGKWSGNEFEPALKQWLVTHAAELQRRRTDFFVRNQISDQIRFWLDYATTEGKVVAMTGDSGIGKTEAIDHYLRNRLDVFRIQASPSRNSCKHLIHSMVDRIGDTHVAFDSARNMADGVVRYFLEFSHLIVLDDFDLLIESGYEFLLRDLWNQTRLGDKTVPQVWLGNEGGIQRIRRLSPQLRSRIRHVKLDTTDAFSAKFVREFMTHHMAPVPATDAMLKAGNIIANLPGSGHLRILRDLCREVRFQVDKLGDDADTVFFDNWEGSDDCNDFRAQQPALLRGIRRPSEVSAAPERKALEGATA